MSKKIIELRLTQQEYDTLLAALRYWQGAMIAGRDLSAEMEIAEFNGPALTSPEIESLVAEMQQS